MSGEYPRSYRVADQIQKDLAAIIRCKIRDPRLQSHQVTLEEVRLSRDLAYAKVFIAAMESDGDACVDVLNRAAGFLRRELSKVMRLRCVPHLQFIHDENASKGQALAQLIDQAVATDNRTESEPTDTSKKDKADGEAT